MYHFCFLIHQQTLLIYFQFQVDVSAKLPNGEDYHKSIELSFEIVPDQSSFKILSTKVINAMR